MKTVVAEVGADRTLVVVVKTNEATMEERYKHLPEKTFTEWKKLHETWKKDIAMGKFYYPKKGDYAGARIVEVENGRVVK